MYKWYLWSLDYSSSFHPKSFPASWWQWAEYHTSMPFIHVPQRLESLTVFIPAKPLRQLASLINITPSKAQELKGEMSCYNLPPLSHMAEKSSHNGYHECHSSCFWQVKYAWNIVPIWKPRITNFFSLCVVDNCSLLAYKSGKTLWMLILFPSLHDTWLWLGLIKLPMKNALTPHHNKRTKITLSRWPGWGSKQTLEWFVYGSTSQIVGRYEKHADFIFVFILP